MIELTLASWRQYRRRYVATFLAVLLGVGFCAATLSLTAAAIRGAGDAAAIQYSKADVVGFPDTMPPSAVVDRLRGLPDVAAADVVSTGCIVVRWPAGHAPGTQDVSEIPASEGLRWQRLTSGRMPLRPDEVVVDASLAADKGVSIGSRLAVGGGQTSRRSVTVVGLVAPEKGASGVSRIFAAPGGLAAWHLSSVVNEIFIKGDGGSQPALAAEVRQLMPTTTVTPTDILRKRAVSDLSHQVDVLGRFLTGFAVVALFVAGLVISNTFRIVMTQRVRDLALLRCVGAERRQVFAMTVGEALLLGVFAAAAGVVAGIACSAILVEVLNHTSIPVPLSLGAPNLTTLLLPFVGGVVMAVAAVLAPASWVSRVAPLTALRPAGEGAPGRRTGLVQFGAGLLVGVFGCLVLTAAVLTGRVYVGILGGLLSFLGVLALAPVVVPVAIRMAGWTRRLLPRRLRGGVPADLAALNAVRNPRRTAATSGALLVGVTLISMMSVGAASVSANEARALDRIAPVDITVAGGPVPAAVLGRARQIPGVQQVVPVRGDVVHSRVGKVRVGSLTAAAAAATVRDDGLRTELADPSVLVLPVSAQRLVPRSGTVVLRSGGVRVRLHPVFSGLTSGPVLVAPAVLHRLGGRLQVGALYVRVSDGADPQAVVSALQDAVGAVGGAHALRVDGGYVERSTYDRAISVMLLVSTALLGMSVLIALVGVGNTLSLSVLERRREHGLLRALGLTTGQLRLLLANEALLMAGAAVLLGTALGVGYGWVGTATLLHGTTSHPPVLALPVARLVLIGAVAMVAGLLASVLPARRAVRVPPVDALRDA